MRRAKTEGKAPQGRKGRTGREGSRRKGRGGQSERPGRVQISEDIKKKILEKIQEHKSSKKVA